LERDYGNLPLAFEPNVGQADPEVHFLMRNGNATVFFADTEAMMVFSRSKKRAPDPLRRLKAPPEIEQAVLRMKLVGAHKPREVLGLEKLSGVTNYLTGSDPKRWRTGIPTYARVKYRDVCPGVDLVYYGNQGQLEYDLIVAPGADPGLVELAFEGAEGIQLDSRGNLSLYTAMGQLSLRKPVIYQESDGIRQDIAGDYILRDGQHVGFRVDRYDPGRPLVIDPVLVYSTFLGPTGGDNEVGWGIAVDSAGNAYVTGVSSSIPTTPGSFRVAPAGSPDAFVAKLNAAGTALIYSTYLGGSSWGASIAVDASGNAYVTGLTYSKDFPTTPGAVQPAWGSDPSEGDAFVSKLNASGTALLYSTYLGGRNGDSGLGIAVDTSGNAYVAGQTCSANFPTTPGAFDTSYGVGARECEKDAFVTKLNATGTALLYSTYLGGIDDDAASSIAVDAAGNAYVTGVTGSSDFPTTPGAFQRVFRGGCFPWACSTAFVAKLNATGANLAYSTYLGGSYRAVGSSIALDSRGDAYVTGFADKALTGPAPQPPLFFPTTPGAFRTAVDGVFVAKLNGTGAIVYSTGLGTGLGTAIAVDSAGNAYVTGYTASDDFPETSDSFHVERWGHACAFITKLNATGTALVYSTRFGSTYGASMTGVAIDSSGDIYVTGEGGGPNFPTTLGAFRAVEGGGTFVAKFTDRPSATTVNTVSAASFFRGWRLAPGSIASAFGQNLALTTEVAASVPLPTSLAGIKVLVKDTAGTEHLAPLFFVSPGQINYLVPEAAAIGPAVLTVVRGDRQVASGHLLIGKVGPGVFTANSDGRGVAAAVAVKVAADGSQTSQPVFRCGTTAGSCVSVPIDLGGEADQVILLLFGTGIRRASLIYVSLGGPPESVLGAGAQSQYPGLDQVNVLLPRYLMGRGEVKILLSADGLDTNPVTVNIR
jgi:uncharacterized protein (TIGR03437 family)